MTTPTNPAIAQQRTAQTDGTTARDTEKTQVDALSKRIPFVLAFLFVLMIGFLTEWSIIVAFAWGFGLLLVSSKVGEIKTLPDAMKHTSTVLNGAGWAMIVGAFFFSQTAQTLKYVVSELDDCIGSISSGDTTNCFEGTPPPPGTQQVTAYRYVENANGGTYELRDDSWLVFHWPDGGTCVRVEDIEGGYIERVRDAKDQYWILARRGTEQVTAKVLQPGETWKGNTC